MTRGPAHAALMRAIDSLTQALKALNETGERWAAREVEHALTLVSQAVAELADDERRR